MQDPQENRKRKHHEGMLQLETDATVSHDTRPNQKKKGRHVATPEIVMQDPPRK